MVRPPEGEALEFEWDATKAASNLAKHGIDFADARLVFLDPFRQERIDRPKLTARSAIKSLALPETTYYLSYMFGADVSAG